MASKHTTSIVDISEIEDDEAPLASGEASMAAQLASRQQQAGAFYSNNSTASNQQQQQPPPNKPASQQQHQQLYLYHEDLHPLQRIPNLLSTMINVNQQQQQQPDFLLASEALSPNQTLLRPAASNLPAIDYYPSSSTERQCSKSASGYAYSPNSAEESQDFRPTTPGFGGGGAEQTDCGSKANLGTLSGVYFPCVQNIFGVILFIRMVWIVGTAGVPAAFALVFICCCVTLTTSISLSAIATNGIVPAGGSYFMISRSLGPECGGAVGTMFFLGTTVAGAMYITGAVEIMLNYLCPSWGLFGDFQRDVNIMYHNIRVYGTVLLIIVGMMVWIGVKFVSKLAPIALFCVLFSIFSIYAGILINYNGRSDLMLCVIGDRLVTLKNLPHEPPLSSIHHQFTNSIDRSSSSTIGVNSNSNNTSNSKLSAAEQARLFEQKRTRALCTFEKLRYLYCPSESPTNQDANNKRSRMNEQQDQFGSSNQVNSGEQGDFYSGGQREQEGAGEKNQEIGDSQERQNQIMRELFNRPPNMSNCDPYFLANRDRIHLEKAVPGIASGVLFQNLVTRFREKRTIVSYGDGVNANEKSDFNNVFVDITTSFTILISIYFPSCTGILAGSNRSGDLADAQKSIPRGTIAAQLTTSFVYLSCVVLFGATFNNLFIRDKFGESMGGQLAVTQIAWPHPHVILIGGLLSTLGAALQSLVGAPRILQGIAKDEVIPCFNRFAKLSSRGEPETAIIATLAISWLAVLIGNLDFIAPILTLSLVMCYFFINLACTLHSLLGSPNWRPRFKHYHWSISTLGCILCLFVMIVSSLLYFLVAIFLAACIYKYIEFSGAEKEWGDGKQGLALSAARYNLLRLKTSEPHTKNWRPQILLFCKLKSAIELEPPSARATLKPANRITSNQLALTSGIETIGLSNNATSTKTNESNTVHHQQQSLLADGAAASKPAAAQPISATAAANNHQAQYNQNQPSPQADLFGTGLDSLKVAHPKLLTFASQLKAGKGLTLVSSIIEGDFKESAGLAAKARAALQETMLEEKVKGFADVLVAPSLMDGLSFQIQSAGLGGLKHNTVIVGWPECWRQTPNQVSHTGSGGLRASSASGVPQAMSVSSIPLPEHRNSRAGGSFKQRNPTSMTSAPSSTSATPALTSSQQQNQQQQQQQQQTSTQSKQTNSRAHLFIELMRNVQVSQNALLVMKGVDSWPESCDKLGGFIDIWWIVNDGGLLMLLPHLLKQHRTWKSCRLRIFTVAQPTDNSMQMREDLRKFLYHLRIEAQVDIVEMNNAEISDYAYERTLMMEQRTEIIKRLNVNRKQSLLLEQEIDGRLIRFRIRKPSTCDFEDSTIAFGHHSNRPQIEHFPMVDIQPHNASNQQQQQQLPSPNNPPSSDSPPTGNVPLNNLRPDEANVRRMHTALTLNEAILKRSKSAKLVIINLPGAPKSSTPEAENNYMEFIEIITDQLERVLLVQNGGREVITIHS